MDRKEKRPKDGAWGTSMFSGGERRRNQPRILSEGNEEIQESMLSQKPSGEGISRRCGQTVAGTSSNMRTEN